MATTSFSKKMASVLLFLSLFLSLTTINLTAVNAADVIPHLEKHGTATRLIVHGKPFLMLAGELHNSSSSNLEYMEKVWPKLHTLNINTVQARQEHHLPMETLK